MIDSSLIAEANSELDIRLGLGLSFKIINKLFASAIILSEGYISVSGLKLYFKYSFGKLSKNHTDTRLPFLSPIRSILANIWFLGGFLFEFCYNILEIF